MKTKTSKIARGFGAVLLAIALSAGVHYVIMYRSLIAFSDSQCNPLEAISNDRVMATKIWGQLAQVIEVQAEVNDSDFGRGTVFVREYEGDFGIDWEALGVTLDIATINMRGKGLALSEFNPKLIDEVRVGYGYRDHLIFTIRDEPGDGGPSEQPPSQWSYDLSFQCKSNPGWQAAK